MIICTHSIGRQVLTKKASQFDRHGGSRDVDDITLNYKSTEGNNPNWIFRGPQRKNATMSFRGPQRKKCDYELSMLLKIVGCLCVQAPERNESLYSTQSAVLRMRNVSTIIQWREMFPLI